MKNCNFCTKYISTIKSLFCMHCKKDYCNSCAVPNEDNIHTATCITCFLEILNDRIVSYDANTTICGQKVSDIGFKFVEILPKDKQHERSCIKASLCDYKKPVKTNPFSRFLDEIPKENNEKNEKKLSTQVKELKMEVNELKQTLNDLISLFETTGNLKKRKKFKWVE